MLSGHFNEFGYKEDDYSGRVRIPKHIFHDQDIRLGDGLSIEILLNNDNKINVLGTAWSDSKNVFNTVDDNKGDNDNNEKIIINAIVLNKPYIQLPLLLKQPFNCELKRVMGFEECTLLECICPSSVILKNSDIRGLVVHQGYFIKIKSKSNGYSNSHDECFVKISKVRPCNYTIISTSTILVTKTETVSTPIHNDVQDNNNSTSDCSSIIWSRTSLIDDLYKILVNPIEIIASISTSITPVSQRLLSGLLLVGPPGSGKSKAMHVLRTHSLKVDIVVTAISLPDLLVSKDPGEELRARLCSIDAEEKKLLAQTVKMKNKSTSFLSPTKSTSKPNHASTSILEIPKLAKPRLRILLFDELDVLGHGNNSDEGSEIGESFAQRDIKRVLCGWMDTVMNCGYWSSVVGTTNNINDVDPCFRRGGRLERDLICATTTESDRQQLLYSMLLKHNYLKGNIGKIEETELLHIVSTIAHSTGGYLPADLDAVVKTGMNQNMTMSLNNTLQSDDKFSEAAIQLLMRLKKACSQIRPSALRGATVRLPLLKFEDVIGQASAKAALHRVFRFSCSSSTSSSTKRNPLAAHVVSQGGVLLYGAPGNSKTRLAQAAAATYSLPMISLSSADLLSAYVGETEAGLRRAFSMARQSAPCVLFFDELDAIVTNRGTSGVGGNGSIESRVLATLLNELDGITGSAGASGIIVIAATNRIAAIDAALLRKGRFASLIEVTAPTALERVDLLDYFGKQFSLPTSVIAELKQKCIFMPDGALSGAEIENMCRECAMDIIRKKFAINKVAEKLRNHCE